MKAEKVISLGVSILCLLSVFLWLYYWLFVASLDSGLGPTVTIVNNPDGSQSFPVTYSYDSAQRYGPYIPLVVLGVFGSIVGSVVGPIVFAANRHVAHRQPAVAIPLSAGLGVLVAVVLAVAIGAALLAFFGQSSFVPNTNSLQRSLGILILLPGLCIFCGVPALMGSVGTSCLLYGLRRSSRQPAIFLS